LSEFRQDEVLLVFEQAQARTEEVLLALEQVQARKSSSHLRVSSGKMN